jgi:hypothetical protein
MKLKLIFTYLFLVGFLASCQKYEPQKSSSPVAPSIKGQPTDSQKKPEASTPDTKPDTDSTQPPLKETPNAQIELPPSQALPNEEIICPNQDPNAKIDQAKSQKIQHHSIMMGSHLLNYLNSTNAQVAVIGRVGRDMSDQSFRYPQIHKYSHVAFAIRKKNTNIWTTVHLLNTCSGPLSDIYDQGLAIFFMDEMFIYDGYVMIPSPQLQQKIASMLNDMRPNRQSLPMVLHNNVYSAIAEPFEGRYQNSNQWVLAVISAAQHGSYTRRHAELSYRNRGFTPSEVYVGLLKSAGKTLDGFITGDKFFPNARVDDHSLYERTRSWFKFVSAASVFDYLARTDPIVLQKELCHPQGCNRTFDQLLTQK